jgi:hypothetical protein
VLVAAARRFFTLLGGIALVTAVLSLLLGLGLGARVNRSLAVGFYLVGCTLLLGGFFAANRGPFRVANEEGLVGLRRPRGVRVVSGDEQAETFNMSGLLVLIGVVLIAFGAAVDSNAELI